MEHSEMTEDQFDAYLYDLAHWDWFKGSTASVSVQGSQAAAAILLCSARQLRVSYERDYPNGIPPSLQIMVEDPPMPHGLPPNLPECLRVLLSDVLPK